MSKDTCGYSRQKGHWKHSCHMLVKKQKTTVQSQFNGAAAGRKIRTQLIPCPSSKLPRGMVYKYIQATVHLFYRYEFLSMYTITDRQIPQSTETTPTAGIPNNRKHLSMSLSITVTLEPLTGEHSFLLCGTTPANLIDRQQVSE